jgi:transposase
MSKERITVKADLELLKSELRKDEKFYQGVRLYAVYQIAAGRNAEDLVALYHTSHKSICNWVSRYNAAGVEGLKDRPHSGRPSGLTMEQKSKLKEVILQSPQEQGYPSATWTWALVADFIEKTFSVKYKKAQIYNILHSVNLSYQKGKGYFPEAKDRKEKVDAIKKNFKGEKQKA